MTNSFDMAIGFDAASMNKAAAVVYQQLYPGVFTGKQKVDKGGLSFDVSWNVEAPPTFILAPPQDGIQIIEDHLALPVASRHFPVSNSEATKALTATLSDQVFQMQLNKMTLTISGSGSSATDPVSLVIYVQASSAGGVLSLDPLKAVATTSNPSDQWFINTVLLPQAMKMAKTLLSSIDLPPLNYPGLKMTAPAIFVDDGRIIAMSNIAGKPVPVPQPGSWPQSAFFALMSNDAKIRVAQANTASMIGKGGGKKGSLNIGIGTVYYDAEFTITSLTFTNASANTLNFSGGIGGSASAGIKIGCSKIGLHYDIYAAPTPSGTITLSGNGDKEVVAKTSKMDTFVLILKPTGNPIEWILSAITDPLLQTLTAAFSPLITKLFDGMSFDAFAIQPIPFSYDKVHLKIEPQGIQISDFQGMMAITGAISVVSS